jgi:hypothetical protein
LTTYRNNDKIIQQLFEEDEYEDGKVSDDEYYGDEDAE